MQDLLYLVHRIPYPPNKGDKIRSYHLLTHLAKRYRVHLGAFIDDPQDERYVAAVGALCTQTCFVRINPRRCKWRSLSGLVSGLPLTMTYYHNSQMQAWVNTVLQSGNVNTVLVFSAAMAQYATGAESTRKIIDFVDVDSAKWNQYATDARWPLRRLYQRESTRLLEYERRIAREFDVSTFVSDAEATLFKSVAPECAARTTYFNNGVDTGYFSPDHVFDNPYPSGTVSLVFTGAMDYHANVDAVVWFAREVFPKIHATHPSCRFYIVGARPSRAVTALTALPGVVVTGTVDDVRPYLAHAAIAVAPLRIARGVQNKVLEAMAMAKTVVASVEAAAGITGRAPRELIVTSDATGFVQTIQSLLSTDAISTIGQAARARILQDYNWARNLSRLDALLVAPRTHRAPAETTVPPATARIASPSDDSCV